LHDCLEILDPDYIPDFYNDPETAEEYNKKNACIHNVLQMRVQTNQGQKIIDEYFHNQDGHGAFNALCQFCERLGHAELRKQEILDRLTSVRTGQFRNAPLLTFINAVTALMKEYDDLDPDGGMSEAMKKSIMKNAVSDAPVLHHVANQSKLEVAMGREPLNWYSYLGLLEDAAINQDNTRRY
jgi:hypothetical protein